jgi:hypothetical protein
VYLPELACVLPQLDALYTRKVTRGAGGLLLYVSIDERIPSDKEEVGSQLLVIGVPYTRLACSTNLYTAVVRCERSVDGLKQGGVAKRFGEEGHRARLQRLGLHGFGPVRRQKNNRESGLARA